jgi:hypothetical protein
MLLTRAALTWRVPLVFLWICLPCLCSQDAQDEGGRVNLAAASSGGSAWALRNQVLVLHWSLDSAQSSFWACSVTKTIHFYV